MGVTFFFLQDCPTCPVQLKGTRSLQDKDLQFPEKDKVHIQISSHNSKDLVYLDWITFFRPVLIYILCQDRGERRTQRQLGQLKMLAVVNKTKFKCHLGGLSVNPVRGCFAVKKMSAFGSSGEWCTALRCSFEVQLFPGRNGLLTSVSNAVLSAEGICLFFSPHSISL